MTLFFSLVSSQDNLTASVSDMITTAAKRAVLAIIEVILT